MTGHTQADYLDIIQLNHIRRDSGFKGPREIRKEMYHKKCIALYKLSKEFSLLDDTLKELFEIWTGTRIEMWKIRDYLYTGFRLTCEQETTPKWVVNVAKQNAN